MDNLNRFVSIAVVVGVVIVLGLYLSYVAGLRHQLNATSNASVQWNYAGPYPVAVIGGQCLYYNSSIYCLGGSNRVIGYVNTTYYAAVNPDGSLGTWKATSVYPGGTGEQSCVQYNGYIYCTGGYNLTYLVSNSYYAKILPGGGLGPWLATTPYPVKMADQACASVAGYMYCVGGVLNYSRTYGQPAALSNSVYYARIGSGGIGNWSQSQQSYPANASSMECFAESQSVYCSVARGYAPIYFATVSDKLFYASVLSHGLTPWNSTAAYPVNGIGVQGCASQNGMLYCVGGSVLNSTQDYLASFYYAKLSANGASSWQQSTQFPINNSPRCAASPTHIYCVTRSPTNASQAYYAALPG